MSTPKSLRRHSEMRYLLMVPCLAACGNVAQRPVAPPVPEATASATPAWDDPAKGTSSAAPSAPPVFFTELVAKARSLGAQAPRPPRKVELPQAFRDMKYDAYRSIRFRPEKALWRGEPGHFEAQFFHPGFFFQEVVDIAELLPMGPRSVPFSMDLFSYDGVPAAPRNAALAFTGFRLHAPLNSNEYRDELIAFLGASYFRPLGKGTVYGLSARGLAMDMGEPSAEEFPRFSEFYLQKPGPEDDFVWVLALLESRRATGAYAFRIQPGASTRIEVSAELFFRDDVAALGVAPLTSMYLFGEEAPNRFGDFRPEVHDSDGLLSWGESGEWLFRPLRNPPRTTVCSFRLDRPRGFGLVQRDRAFANYQDLEARYQDRPSVWIEPLSGFERGNLRLLEIATELETDDNIAIAFVPDTVSDRKLSVRYRLHVGEALPMAAERAHVVASRVARTKQGSRFLVDFSGGEIGAKKGVEPVVSAQNGRVVEQHVEHNPFTNGFRASFEVLADPGAKDVELRTFLRTKDTVLTETWSYLWQPTR